MLILTIDTDREKMLRIEQITKDGMLDEYGLEPEVVDEAIVDYIVRDIQKTACVNCEFAYST